MITHRKTLIPLLAYLLALHGLLSAEFAVNNSLQYYNDLESTIDNSKDTILVIIEDMKDKEIITNLNQYKLLRKECISKFKDIKLGLHKIEKVFESSLAKERDKKQKAFDFANEVEKKAIIKYGKNYLEQYKKNSKDVERDYKLSVAKIKQENRLRDLENELKHTQSVLSEKNNTIDFLEKKCNDLEEKDKKSSLERDENKSKIDGLLMQISKERDKSDEYLDELKDLRKLKENNKAQIAELEKTKEDEEQTIEDLKEDLYRWKKKYDDLDKDYVKMKKDFNNYKKSKWTIFK